MNPSPVGCQALPCAEPAGYLLVGPRHEAAGCRTLEDPVLLLAHEWSELGSQVSGYRAGAHGSSLHLLVAGASS